MGKTRGGVRGVLEQAEEIRGEKQGTISAGEHERDNRNTETTRPTKTTESKYITGETIHTQ